jgi:hypothetical protein
MQTWIRLFENADETPYVRFGDLPKNGRSEIGAAPNWVAAMGQKDTHEQGVSVYPLHWNDERQRFWIECYNLASLDELLAQKRPAFLVHGEPIWDEEEGFEATGMDGEPLLKDAQVVRQLKYEELYIREWSDVLPEEYLDEGKPALSYIEQLNKDSSPVTGQVLAIETNGEVRKMGEMTLRLGDLTELLDCTYGFAQGPHTVTYEGQQWNMYWPGFHDGVVNPLSSKLIGGKLEGPAILVSR